MKERPILFKSEMVRAILDGSKTQTRRIVKPQPVWNTKPYDRPGFFDDAGRWFGSPYGLPGDRLWVRETWSVCDTVEPPLDDDPEGGPYTGMVDVIYRATNEVRPSGVPHTSTLRRVPDHVVEDWQDEIERMEQEGDRWKPSIHMPRWASRITLEVTEVRVQRLQDISSFDAQDEGVNVFDFPGDHRLGDETQYQSCYRLLWDQINGPGSWGANPWVWAISFKRIEPALLLASGVTLEGTDAL